MERVTSTIQLHRGQSVIQVERSGDVRVNYHRFISEDLSNSSEIKAKYGYFADIADRPVRFYLGNRGAEIYKDYTDEDIMRMRKETLENTLAKIEMSLKMLRENNN